MNFPVLVLAVVLVLIAVRRVGALRIQIWQAMLFGAIAVLLSGNIAMADAFYAINWDVMGFLFGMFIIGRAMIVSGFLEHVVEPLFYGPSRRVGVVAAFVFFTGFASAFLMNDTLAIIGVPLALRLAQRFGLEPKMLLLALAFSVTTGSVMSPIGNPQNLLIAIGSEMTNPFLTFLSNLLLPTAISLCLVYVVLRLCYRKSANAPGIDVTTRPPYDDRLARSVKFALAILCTLIGLHVVLTVSGAPLHVRLSVIALLSALPLIVARSRLNLIKTVDWQTLVFFAAMFVLMQAVWQSGFFQQWLSDRQLSLTDPFAILAISVGLSQLTSNVPLVALYLPLMPAPADIDAFLLLAAGSTLAGNIMIVGAASNVIIVQMAERQGVYVSFWEFARIGVPLTLLQLMIFWLFLV